MAKISQEKKVIMGGEEEEGEEDERREAAMASTTSLQPSFKPKQVNQDQLSKLQELHKRRLQLKSKIHKKSKGGTAQLHGKHPTFCGHKDSNIEDEDIHIPSLESHSGITNSSVCQGHVVGRSAPKNRQKLHWGLDTKERWERKANM